MPKVRDVSRHIRSKNAGQFWITVDLFFDGAENFQRHASSAALKPEAIAGLFGTDARLVKHIPVPDLTMLKISYPRSAVQGGAHERDMHGGQQYVRLLDVEL